MDYCEKLSNEIRAYLMLFPELNIEEKKMFRGLTFMINGKMCMSVNSNELMIRFAPSLHEKFCEQDGFRPMLTKDREYKGYGYVHCDFIKTQNELMHWLKLAMDYNHVLTTSGKV